MVWFKHISPKGIKNLHKSIFIMWKAMYLIVRNIIKASSHEFFSPKAQDLSSPTFWFSIYE